MQQLPNNAPMWPQRTPELTPQSAPQRTPTDGPERMPTAEARRRSKTLKRLALAGTTLTFCALAGLAAGHVTGVTSAAGASATATPANQDDHGGFFPGSGHGSDDEGEHDGQGGGFNFGSGGGNFQSPASSSGGS